MKKTSKLLLLISVLAFIAGCATVSGAGTSQPISIQTFASDGKEVEGVRCEMTNDEGSWFVTSPGSTTVRKSNKDLQVVCRKAGMDIGTASVVSRTKGNMWGNIILGGGIGAIIDHNNGSAYEYPGLIKVYMGRTNQRIEDANANSSNLNAPVATTRSDLNLDDAKKQCEELGFKVATEQFGNCVLKLAK